MPSRDGFPARRVRGDAPEPGPGPRPGPGRRSRPERRSGPHFGRNPALEASSCEASPPPRPRPCGPTHGASARLGDGHRSRRLRPASGPQVPRPRVRSRDRGGIDRLPFCANDLDRRAFGCLRGAAFARAAIRCDAASTTRPTRPAPGRAAVPSEASRTRSRPRHPSSPAPSRPARAAGRHAASGDGPENAARAGPSRRVRVRRPHGRVRDRSGAADRIVGRSRPRHIRGPSGAVRGRRIGGIARRRPEARPYPATGSKDGARTPRARRSTIRRRRSTTNVVLASRRSRVFGGRVSSRRGSPARPCTGTPNRKTVSGRPPAGAVERDRDRRGGPAPLAGLPARSLGTADRSRGDRKRSGGAEVADPGRGGRPPEMPGPRDPAIRVLADASIGDAP